jgi:hypothetical protein
LRLHNPLSEPLEQRISPITGTASPNRVGVADGEKNQHGRAAATAMTPAKMGDRTMAWKITVQAARNTAGKPQDMFLMVDGLKIARRGYPDTPEAGTWVPIEPGWEVKDVLGGDEIWVRYTNPVSGEVITFPEGERQ